MDDIAAAERVLRIVADAQASRSRTETLALYHAERERGLVHTAEYAARMAELQARYDADTKQQARDAADEVTQKRRAAIGLSSPWPMAPLSAANGG